MNTMHEMAHGRWTIPAISGFLIVLALVTERLSDAEVVAPVAMVAAAVVAGTPIAIKAVNALMAKVVGIDLLVAVAAVGAVIIGEYWEAAAVTFLFAIGHALELATLNKTRSALAELIAVAPDTAVVMRENQQVEIPAVQVITGETVLVKNGAKVPVDGDVIGGTGGLDEASISSFAGRQAHYENFFFGDPIRMAGALVNAYDREPARQRVRDLLAREEH
ncbi:MAG: hypothetical protein JJE28_04580 [Actinomycetales bacterium]|nr:hypothetical protein [Actinomycetales bacterium]